MSTQQQQDAEMCQPVETACQSGLQKLPLELVYHIVRLAASTDSKTAHACAYVSKEVCGWTAPDRWKTVICTSVRQLQVLHSILLSHEIQGRRFLTLPSRAPGHFVEHLFIDTQGSRCDVFEHSLQPGQDAKGAQMGTTPQGADSPQQLPSPIRENMVFQVLGSCLHANYVALGPDELYNLEAACPYISAKKKMITSDDEDVLHEFLSRMANRDQYHDEGLYRDTYNFWQPGHCLESLEGLQALHVISVNRDSEVTGAPMPIRELEALRSGSVAETGLMRTTAVSRFLPPAAGQDDRRDMANRATIRASLEEYERQNERNQALADQHIVRAEQDPFRNPYGQITTQQQELSHGVTKLRYDTRKFSFRPCEITASRLKPFFEELTTTTAPTLPLANEDDDTARSRAPEFAHSGPRHAAPARGAGNYSVPNSDNMSQGRIPTPKRAALKFLGCHRFSKLHLCWDPAPASFLPPHGFIAKQDTTTPNTTSTSTAKTAASDWPMERQDIWTNTSSQNNQAKALPPHNGNARNGRGHSNQALHSTRPDTSKSEPAPVGASTAWIIPPDLENAQSKAFRADMVDALRTSIGWTRHDQQLLSDTPWLSPDRVRLIQRVGAEGLDELEHLTNVVASHINNPDPETPSSIKSDFKPTGMPLSADEQLALEFVPPKDRLRLGGMYVPYTKEQRLKWFLDNLYTDEA
ncbi:uncharacterized protein UDID_07667 [Ustilago sp. UG-2017a]|nr:uncharacterized protein UDID_07667 [Ustilago sp. UG-2017a]